MTNPLGITTADMLLALNLTARADHLVQETAILAQTLGTTASLGQVLGAVLTAGWDHDGPQISREDFINVFDIAAATIGYVSAPARTGGPEDTAHAASAEEASKMAGEWGAAITTAAFDLNVPATLGDFPEENIDG